MVAVIALTASLLTAQSIHAAPARADTGAMIQPVTGVVTGVLSNRCGSTDSDHLGIDINGPGVDGRSIVAAYAGTVTQAGLNGGYGQSVTINHGSGYVTRYAHMKYTPAVSAGQAVQRGTVIGYVGNTGNSFGSHLHFEIHRNGNPQFAAGGYSCGQSLTQGNAIPLDFPGLSAGTDRSFSITTAGSLEGKLGMYEPVVHLRDNIVAVDADGTTVAAVDSAGSVWVQQGNFTNGWVGLASNAIDVAVDGDRYVVLHADGTVRAKDGLYSTTWTNQLGGATQIDAADGRIGVLAGGTLFVKEGNLWADWTNQLGGVTDFALDGNRIGVVAGGMAHVKEGNLWDSWVPMAGASQIELSGDRIALRSGTTVNVKEGTLWAGWETVAPYADDVALSGDRIAVRSGGSVLIKAGPLSATWNGAYANSAQIALN